jgi:preprotein translocase subunit YajC
MEQFIPLILIFAVFWFLLIRPQQRRTRMHRELLRSLEVGDEVVTAGGMYGRIKRLDDIDVWLEVANGTVIRFARGSVGRKVEPDIPASESAETDSD